MNEWDIALNNLRDHGRSILVGIAVGFICAILIILFQKPLYQASMIVGPTEKTGVPSLSSFLPKTAADAPALQYFVERIDASQATDFTVFETKIQSPQMVQNAMEDDITDNIDKWISKHLKIRSHGMTSFKKITLTGRDKKMINQLLSRLYNITDQDIRSNKKAKAMRRITYLNQQLKTVRNPDHRDVIVALLKEQEQIVMMVAIDKAFAAEIITPPYISEKPIAPNGQILFPAFIFAGGFLGLMFGGLRQALNK